MTRKLRVGLVMVAAMAMIGWASSPSYGWDETPKDDSAKAAASAKDDHKQDDHKHEGGGHGHDETDLGHANASAALASPADVRFDTSIYTFVIFLLLLIILGKFAWGPITEGLERREKSIADMILAAETNQRKAAEQLKAYEAKLAAAAEEARELTAQAKRDAEAIREGMLADAKAAATRERERAVEDITNAKNAALQEIAEKSVNTAVKLASNIVRREIRGDEHAALIREAVDKFPSSN